MYNDITIRKNKFKCQICGDEVIRSMSNASKVKFTCFDCKKDRATKRLRKIREQKQLDKLEK